MYGKIKDFLQEELSNIKEAGLFKDERIIVFDLGGGTFDVSVLEVADAGDDDGENRVGADLMMMIWTALQQQGIEIPFPQRVVTVNDGTTLP